MSYVAISASFINDVKSKLRQMRNKEVSAIPSLDYKISNTRTDLVGWAWGKHLHLMEQMPAKWCQKISSTSLRIDKADRQLRMSVDIVPPLVTPPGDSPSGLLSVSPDDPEIKAFVDHEQTLYEIKQRWDKVDEQIVAFFKKCKSVNEALKLWPQIEMYIPSQYIDRVNEKKERSSGGPSEAAEALKKLDTDHLTTAAVISRMSGQE
jgi:hypothetical protein